MNHNSFYIKQILTLLTLVLFNYQLHAGDATKNDSYTIQRLILINDADQILLLKHPNGWMTPALRHSEKVTTQEGLIALAEQYGGQINRPTLAGVFMFLPEYETPASFRQYFRAQWISGEVKLPGGDILEARWFDLDSAYQALSNPEKKVLGEQEMTMQLTRFPNTIWGGSYRIWKDGDDIKYEMAESFFSLAAH